MIDDEPNYSGWDFDGWTDEDFEQLWEERAAIREMEDYSNAEHQIASDAQKKLRRWHAERMAYWDIRKLSGRRKFSARVMEAAKGGRSATDTDDKA